MSSQEPPVSADDANGAGATPAPDSPAAKPSLEDLLKQAEAKAEEHKDAWLRAKAETENARKRAQEDITKAHKFAVESSVFRGIWWFRGDLTLRACLKIHVD